MPRICAYSTGRVIPTCLLFEWFSPSFVIGNLAQGLAFLLTFPDGLSRVAERKDRQDRDLLGNAQQGVDLRQVIVAHPVGTPSLLILQVYLPLFSGLRPLRFETSPFRCSCSYQENSSKNNG